jgi:hypothetical protein
MLPAGLQDKLYAKHYGYLCKHPGSYVILDNGMFEDNAVTNLELIQLAKDYNVDEIVLPDKRGDGVETLALQREFLHLYRAAYSLVSRPPKVMAVVQGKTLKECYAHIDMISQYLQPIPDIVLGFPRRLSEDIDRAARVDLCAYIADNRGPLFPIHLLGLSRANPREVQFIAREFKDLVRGIDTDAPFVWTAEHKHLDTNDTAERQTHYMEMGAQQFSGHLLQHNINTLERWCRGE